MANSLIDGPQSRVNGGANTLTGLVGLIPPKSADLVGNSIGSAQTLGLNGRYGKGHMRNWYLECEDNAKKRKTLKHQKRNESK